MGIVAITAAAYARAQKLLLPPGSLWNLSPGSVLSAIFLATGDELARVSGRVVDMIEEADSRTTTELLPDFERELTLPSTGTDEERRLRITAKENQRPRVRPVDILAALAPYLDCDAVDLEMIELTNAAAVAAGDETLVFQFYVYRDPALGGAPDLAAAQIELDRISHSYTRGYVITSTGFQCDNANSLCDRDLLGV